MEYSKLTPLEMMYSKNDNLDDDDEFNDMQESKIELVTQIIGISDAISKILEIIVSDGNYFTSVYYYKNNINIETKFKKFGIYKLSIISKKGLRIFYEYEEILEGDRKIDNPVDFSNYNEFDKKKIKSIPYHWVSKFTTIKDLNINDFDKSILKVMVKSKDVVTSKKGNKFIKLLLQDNTGKIVCLCFNQSMDLTNEMQINKVYTIENFDFKKDNSNNRKSVSNSHTIFFKDTTKLKMVKDDDFKIKENFSNLESILKMQIGSIVNSIWIVKEVNDIRLVGPDQKRLQNYILFDDTYNSIKFSLWDNKIDSCELKKNDIVVLIGLRLNEYNNSLNLSIDYNYFEIHKNYEGSRFKEIKKFYNYYINNKIKVKIIDNDSKINIDTKVMNIQEINDDFENLNSEDKIDAIIIGYIVNINDKFFYKACPYCYKSANYIEEGSDSVNCENCSKKIDACAYKYILNCTFSDASGTTYFTCFYNNVCKRMFDGLECKELIDLKENDLDKFDEIFNSIKNKQIICKLKIVENNYMSERQKKTNLTNFNIIDSDKTGTLIELIEKKLSYMLN